MKDQSDHRSLRSGCRCPLLVALASAVVASCSNGLASDMTDVDRWELTITFERDSLLFAIVDVAVDTAGSVWVLSARAPHVYGYDAEGPLVRRFGVRGPGPGELRKPWSIIAAPSVSEPVVVWDVGVNRLVAFSSDGQASNARGLPFAVPTLKNGFERESYGTPLRAVHAQGGLLLHITAGPVMRTSDLRSSMLAYSRNNGGVDTLDVFPPANSYPDPPGIFDSVPLWDTCSASSFAVLDPITSELRRYTYSQGEWTMAQRAPVRLERRRIGEADIFRYLRMAIAREMRMEGADTTQLEPLVRQVFSRSRGTFAARAPIAVELLCDGEQHVWLREFDTARDPVGRGERWWVYSWSSGGGAWVNPPTTFVPRLVRNGLVLGTMRDSVDVEGVAAFQFKARRISNQARLPHESK